ncbi:MAG: NAD(P)H-dependent D-xylose reductase (XR) [Cirrosporium novae-zelandiae]|nr:MAG: NAD(P)H-dependent D-xylose reductase (XR) [Cirrosporium novae-zelandiae]
MASETIKLASGMEMPLVGFGLWKVLKESAADTVYNAIKVGYRLFDGAYDYQNEAEAGQGIKRAIDEGLVKREDIFVTTKLWCNYKRKEHATKMTRAQIDAWGLGYIDLFLIHFPVALKYIDPKVVPYPGFTSDEKGNIELDRVPIRETWEVLESLVDDGLVKSIGVSNFQAQSLYDLQSYCKHPVSALQIEHHPYLVQPTLISMAQENGIAVTAYSSFGPQSFLELPGQFSERAKGIAPLFETMTIQKIANKHGVTPAQVLLRWATQRGVAVIPKSNSPDRLKQNLEVNHFDLTSDEINEITNMDRGLRFNDPGYTLSKPLRIFA